MHFVKDEEIIKRKKAFLGPSKAMPDMALKASDIAKRFTTPSYDEFAKLNRYNEEQDFSAFCVDDFDDISDIFRVVANSKAMIQAYEKAMKKDAEKARIQALIDEQKRTEVNK